MAMTVLHIGDCAGVAHTLAKYQRRLGVEADVITKRESNPYDFDVLYGIGDNRDYGTYRYVAWALLKSLRYNLIHVHAVSSMMKYLRLMYPNKPIVLQYHGTDIRDRWEEMKPHWIKADKVLVATKDLLSIHATLLPRPIDRELFVPTNNPIKNTALFFYRDVEYLPLALRYSYENNLKLTAYDTGKNVIPSKDMPRLLNSYEFLIDFKGYEVLSKVALEALACGVKVINHREEIVTELPEENYAEEVARKSIDVYKEVCP